MSEQDPRDTDETSAAFLARLGMDGTKWAAGFRKTAIRLGYSDMDEGWLVAWFCNAIMAGWDERGRRPDPRDARIAELEAEVERLREQRDAISHDYERANRASGREPASTLPLSSYIRQLVAHSEKTDEAYDAALSRARRAEDERAMAEWRRKRVEQERDAARAAASAAWAAASAAKTAGEAPLDLIALAERAIAEEPTP